MVAFNKFNCFVEDRAHKKHDLSADTLKVMLTNTAPVATNAVKTDITEIAAGNGYTAGGFAVSRISSGQVSGTYTLKLNDQPTAFAAAGGAVGPYRYAVLYNDTAAAKNLIGWWDFGSNITQPDGQAFKFDPTDGAGTILQDV